MAGHYTPRLSTLVALVHVHMISDTFSSLRGVIAVARPSRSKPGARFLAYASEQAPQSPRVGLVPDH